MGVGVGVSYKSVARLERLSGVILVSFFASQIWWSFESCSVLFTFLRWARGSRRLQIREAPCEEEQGNHRGDGGFSLCRIKEDVLEQLLDFSMSHIKKGHRGSGDDHLTTTHLGMYPSRHHEIRLPLSQLCKPPLQLLSSGQCGPHAIGVESPLPCREAQHRGLAPSWCPRRKGGQRWFRAG